MSKAWKSIWDSLHESAHALRMHFYSCSNKFPPCGLFSQRMWGTHTMPQQATALQAQTALQFPSSIMQPHALQ